MSHTGGPPVRVFVAPDGNAFMSDIADWVVEAATALGRTAQRVTDRLPGRDGATNLVVAPHEFYTLRRDRDVDVRRAATASVPICTEQPGTPWFRLSAGLCAGSPLVVDINEIGASALRQRGFDVERLRLGGVPSMVHDSEPSPRDVDVVFLGGATPRRNRVLASLAPLLWDRSGEIRTFSFSRPVTGDEPGVVFGADKYQLLARSRVLVNIHRGDVDGADAEEYFEWARMVEAMANGCVVLTEPSSGHDPLVAGTHFVETTADDMGGALVELLDDADRRDGIAAAAKQAVMDELALERSLREVLDRADAALAAAPEMPARTKWLRRPTPVEREAPPPVLPVFAPYRDVRRDLYDQLLAEMAHRRELGQLRALIEHGDADHVAVTASSAWDDARPDVSVAVTVYGYADVVAETLDSIISSRDVATEIIVVDDASTDGGADVVRSWMLEHDDIPVLFLERAANRGLVRARNLAVEHARADLVMIVDADNLLYPTCLRRLADALAADPDAAFAYATLEAFGADPGLRSAQGWYVPWLCDANYIDAQAMIRRDALTGLGGYRIDDAMYGWEDWDLWLRIAAAGGHGVHVPQMLGRYRTQEGSMVSLTNLVADDLRRSLVERYPELPWPPSDSP